MGYEYDKKAVGKRLQTQRKLLGYTQESMSEQLEKSTKYYADVERGKIGMSIEVLLAVCYHLNLSPNYVLLGEIFEDDFSKQENISQVLAEYTPQQRSVVCKMLKLLAPSSKDV